jgi:hypothetical protein
MSKKYRFTFFVLSARNSAETNYYESSSRPMVLHYESAGEPVEIFTQ